MNGTGHIIIPINKQRIFRASSAYKGKYTIRGITPYSQSESQVILSKQEFYTYVKYAWEKLNPQ